MRAAGGVLLALVALSSGARAETPSLRRIAFAPHWKPQAQFAGYYVALEHGFYARRGLDVTILEDAPERSPSRLLADGVADVASLWLTTAIQDRERDVPLVNVAQVLQRSSLLVIAKTSSGIRRPADLRGRKVGVWDGEFLLQPLEFLHRYDVDADLVPLGSTINLFLRGGVDATVATWFNDYHSILNSGMEARELTTFFLGEHGVDFPEDGLYCREDALQADPGPCRDFVQASAQGWDHAFAHPDEAVDLVMRYMLRAHVGTNAAHQRWMLARMQDLMQPSRARAAAGVLLRDDYERAGEALRKNGWIARVPEYQDFHRPLVAAP